MATISPIDPGEGGSDMVARRISSTDTDDRFPLSRSDFRVRSRASEGSSSTLSTASITFGPAACNTHVEMSAVAQSVVGEELADVVTQVFLDDCRDLDGQDDLEPVAADIPAQHIFGVGVGTAAGGQHLRPRRGAVGPRRDQRARAVTEQAGGDEVRYRIVLALNCQRAQLNGEQCGHLIRESAQVVVHPRQSGGTGDTAQPEQRDPFDIGPKPQRVISRASSDGTASPVTVVEKMTSTSDGSTPAFASADTSARSPSSRAMSR